MHTIVIMNPLPRAQLDPIAGGPVVIDGDAVLDAAIAGAQPDPDQRVDLRDSDDQRIGRLGGDLDRVAGPGRWIPDRGERGGVIWA